MKDKPELKLIEAYVGRDSSGENFNRAGFRQMLFDLYRGKINCVMVKDILRFGRNYIEVGNYLENIFPLLRIRFISVNNQIDTQGKEIVLTGQEKIDWLHKVLKSKAFLVEYIVQEQFLIRVSKNGEIGSDNREIKNNYEMFKIGKYIHLF